MTDVVSENEANEAVVKSKGDANESENISVPNTSGENGTCESTENIENEKKRATQLFLQGKRHLCIRDYQAGVASLAEAVQTLIKIYDEDAEELGDPYFYYGKALFELARNESDVLGDKMEKKDETNEDGEEEEDDEEDGEGEQEEQEEKEGDENATKKGESNGTDGGDGEGGGEEEEKASEVSDVDDLQLSWEYLELAKMIYEKKAATCRDTAIKLSEVFLTLGENSMESERYPTAIEDISKCLALQVDNLAETDRRIAETHYQLGIAHSLDKNFDDAVTCFQAAIVQLEKKLKWLEQRKANGEEKTDEEKQDPFYSFDREMEEMNSVIKDIKEKITDMLDHKKQMIEDIMKQMTGPTTGAGASTSTSGDAAEPVPSEEAKPVQAKPVSNISHLIRKKRKNEDDSQVQAADEKKPKTE